MAMRSMWKGAVSFGLVAIPVRLYAATEQHDVSFRQVRASDGSRIRYKRVAEADGEEVPYPEIVKGYETADGRMIVIDDQDLADLPLPSKRIVDVLEFVPLSEVDPIYFNKSYYLEPDKGGLKPYALLRDALKNSAMVGVVKVAIGNKEQLATLRVKDDVMVLATMMWPDEIRTPAFGFLKEEIPVRPQELAMAESLITSMASTFDPTEFRDEFQDALAEMLAAKIGDAVPAPAESPVAAPAGNVVDLLGALQASIDKARAGKAPTPAAGSDVDPEAEPAPAKRPRKAAAKPAGSKPAAADSIEPEPATAAKKAPAKRARKTA